MKKLYTLVIAVVLLAGLSSVALAGVAESGGYLVPDTSISQRLTIGTTYTDLNDGNSANIIEASLGVLDVLELSYGRVDASTNVFGAKLGINYLKKDYGVGAALGVTGTTVESAGNLNSLDLYLALSGKVKFIDLVGVARSTDVSGEREYLFEGSLGAEVIKGVSLYGEFAQKPNLLDNQLAVYVQRSITNANVRVGVTSLDKFNENQVFVSAYISGI